MTLRHLLHAAVETARISAPTVLESALGRLSPDNVDRRLDVWSRRIVERARIELTTVGDDQFAAGGAMVVMSNHQSLYDIPVLYRAFRRPLRMVAKGELFRVPLWGTAMRRAGFVELDRGDRTRAIESLSRATSVLSRGMSIWIAPEGTRSVDGTLGEFKRGGFHLAEDAGVRILPVTIVGTKLVLPARGRSVTEGVAVTVTLHPPIDPGDYGSERRAELIAAVRQRIESALLPATPRPSAAEPTAAPRD
jgi:1-acyl-sn-glycerol-3-phosphate acyltransferase